MKKTLILLISLAFILASANCKSVNKKKVGEQEVIMVDQAVLSFFWKKRNKVGKCVEVLEKEGATKVIKVAGPRTFLTSDFSFSGGTTDTPACSAIGTK